MPRIAVTSDLHYDVTRALTPPEAVARAVDDMLGARPDAIVIAGDIGHPLANFLACLDLFSRRGVPVGIVCGNHDVWRDAAFDSATLWRETLPAAVRDRGLVWLETDAIRVGAVALVGSMAWYDYSAADLSLGKNEAFFRAVKPQLSNDAYWLDWPLSDVEVATLLRLGLIDRLQLLEADAAVERVAVFTHVPLLVEQLRRDSSDARFALANAFFGNLRTGRDLVRFRKVTTVVSGHTHFAKSARVVRSGMADIQALSVGGDYGAPAWLMVQV
jgi:predicted phosphodiesterase